MADQRDNRRNVFSRVSKKLKIGGRIETRTINGTEFVIALPELSDIESSFDDLGDAA